VRTACDFLEESNWRTRTCATSAPPEQELRWKGSALSSSVGLIASGPEELAVNGVRLPGVLELCRPTGASRPLRLGKNQPAVLALQYCFGSAKRLAHDVGTRGGMSSIGAYWDLFFSRGKAIIEYTARAIHPSVASGRSGNRVTRLER
jgi:hypothetical protein